MVQAEGEALVRRLHEDVAFRESLLRSLILAATDNIESDLGSPQRLSLLWRQAHHIQRWEDFLDLGDHVQETVNIR